MPKESAKKIESETIELKEGMELTRAQMEKIIQEEFMGDPRLSISERGSFRIIGIDDKGKRKEIIIPPYSHIGIPGNPKVQDVIKQSLEELPS